MSVVIDLLVHRDCRRLLANPRTRAAITAMARAVLASARAPWRRGTWRLG